MTLSEDGLAAWFGPCPLINHSPRISSVLKQGRAVQHGVLTILGNDINHFTRLMFLTIVARALLYESQVKIETAVRKTGSVKKRDLVFVVLKIIREGDPHEKD